MEIKLIEEIVKDWIKEMQHFTLFFDEASKGNLGVAGAEGGLGYYMSPRDIWFFSMFGGLESQLITNMRLFLCGEDFTLHMENGSVVSQSLEIC